MNGINRKYYYSLVIFFLLSGCSSLWGNPADVGLGLILTKTPTTFLPKEIEPSIQASASTPIPIPIKASQVPEIVENGGIWIGEAVSPKLRSYIEDAGFKISDNSSTAEFHLDAQVDLDKRITTWVYALVVPFYTIEDNIEWEKILRIWKGEGSGLTEDYPMWMDSSTYNSISAILGTPASTKIIIVDSGGLIDSVWENQPAWGIVPFEDLEPGWKVISIDGNSPYSNEFDINNYPIKVSFGFEESNSPPNLNIPNSNRDPDKFTSLVMTGVTAMVRATAGKMEQNGVLYPGKDIRNWLLSADLTHISNEIPFSDDCPFPDPNQKTLVFCSNKKYIALLEDVGTDIVELTGNHFQDYGSAATYTTLDMYDQEGWAYFGGGATLDVARSPKMIIHNGNKLAFIGCNPAGPQFAWATDYQPGAAPCDYDWIHAEISRLASEGYLPIVTFQYVESYSVQPLPDQVEDFRGMAAAGAVIISGSQAHLPQTMEFFNKSFIHYGLGNLFFDQMDYPVAGTRREFIDRHIFYDGKYMGTELLTAILEDYSRPRPMNNEERTVFLQDIFTASGW